MGGGGGCEIRIIHVVSYGITIGKVAYNHREGGL